MQIFEETLFLKATLLHSVLFNLLCIFHLFLRTPAVNFVSEFIASFETPSIKLLLKINAGSDKVQRALLPFYQLSLRASTKHLVG